MPTSHPDETTTVVLLFSPLAGRDPLSGDTSYTEALLAEPPPGVSYVTYGDALDDGVLQVRGRRTDWRHWTPVDAFVFVLRALELTLRRLHIMYREPIWWVSIDRAAVALVHQHLFAVRQIGSRCPVMSSAGLPLDEWYMAREHWPRWRAALATALEWVWAATCDVHVPWLRSSRGGVLTVYSDHMASRLAAAGNRRPLVMGTGLPDDGVVPTGSALDSHERPPRAAFIGRDFDRKGGGVALESYLLARRSLPHLEFVIVTSSTARLPGIALEDPLVSVILDAPRDVVVGEVLPSVDVLIAPTRLDCGAPFGVLEALRAGVPVVMAPSRWLSPDLRYPAVAFAEPTGAMTSRAVLEMFAISRNRRQALARALFTDRFTMSAIHGPLSSAYAMATESQSP